MQADVTKAASIAAIMQSATKRFGTIEVLFSNAELFDLVPLLESNEAKYHRLFDVNVKGMFFVMPTVLQGMVDGGLKGSVIDLASQTGRCGEAPVSYYCATKAAVISYTQSALLAMAPHGIRVNGIAPGMVDTPMWAHVDAMFAKIRESGHRREEGRGLGSAAGPYGPVGHHRRRRLPSQR